MGKQPATSGPPPKPKKTPTPALAYMPKFIEDPEVSSEQPMHHAVSLKTYLVVFAALMVLLLVTVGAAFVNLGPLNFPMAMAIATVKAVLVVLFFMHVYDASRLTKIFVVGTLVWLGIMFILTFSDYVTRGMLPMSRGWSDEVKLIVESPVTGSMEKHRSPDDPLAPRSEEVKGND